MRADSARPSCREPHAPLLNLREMSSDPAVAGVGAGATAPLGGAEGDASVAPGASAAPAAASAPAASPQAETASAASAASAAEGTETTGAAPAESTAAAAAAPVGDSAPPPEVDASVKTESTPAAAAAAAETSDVAAAPAENTAAAPVDSAPPAQAASAETEARPAAAEPSGAAPAESTAAAPVDSESTAASAPAGGDEEGADGKMPAAPAAAASGDAAAQPAAASEADKAKPAAAGSAQARPSTRHMGKRPADDAGEHAHPTFLYCGYGQTTANVCCARYFSCCSVTADGAASPKRSKPSELEAKVRRAIPEFTEVNLHPPPTHPPREPPVRCHCRQRHVHLSVLLIINSIYRSLAVFALPSGGRITRGERAANCRHRQTPAREVQVQAEGRPRAGREEDPAAQSQHTPDRCAIQGPQNRGRGY